jgi:hypothetical protein
VAGERLLPTSDREPAFFDRPAGRLSYVDLSLETASVDPDDSRRAGRPQ